MEKFSSQNSLCAAILSGCVFIDWNAKPCGVFFCQNQALLNLRPPVTNCKAAAKPSRAQVEADPSQFRCAWYHQKSFIFISCWAVYLLTLQTFFLIIHFYTNDNRMPGFRDSCLVLLGCYQLVCLYKNIKNSEFKNFSKQYLWTRYHLRIF